MASKWHGKGKDRWRYVRLKKPPPGTYDIGLDQSLRASRRGLSDLIGDIAPVALSERQKLLGKKTKRPAGTQALRSYFDWKTATGENARQRNYLAQDYGIGKEAIGRDYGRTIEDLQSQEDTLTRNYGQLANSQRQNFQAAGLADGGAAAQAAAKRASNFAFEMKPINVTRTRALEDRNTSLSDLLRQNQRSTMDLNNQLGQISLTYGRGVEDNATQLSRARREANQYARDIAQTKMNQYTQGGGRTRRRVGVKQYRKLRRQGAI